MMFNELKICYRMLFMLIILFRMFNMLIILLLVNYCDNIIVRGCLICNGMINVSTILLYYV